jgi:hypothetical protein
VVPGKRDRFQFHNLKAVGPADALRGRPSARIALSDQRPIPNMPNENIPKNLELPLPKSLSTDELSSVAISKF